MNQQDFEALCKAIQRDTVDILVLKGREYAGSADRLANFRRNAALTGVEPLTILHVYMAKHWDSFSTFVRDNQKGEEGELSEPIRGRLYDLINYAVLAIALIEDLPKESPGSFALWVKFSGHHDSHLLSGESAVRALNVIKAGNPMFDGLRILAYRTSTDQPWTNLQ